MPFSFSFAFFFQSLQPLMQTYTDMLWRLKKKKKIKQKQKYRDRFHENILDFTNNLCLEDVSVFTDGYALV